MRTITVTVEVPRPKGKLSLAKLERAVHQGGHGRGQEGPGHRPGAWEQELLREAGARQRRVRRYLLTRVGPIRFHRWKTRKDGRYGFPLDQAMGLRPWQTCSGFVWERACRLAGSHPFRQAARLLSDLVGTPVDRRRRRPRPGRALDLLGPSGPVAPRGPLDDGVGRSGTDGAQAGPGDAGVPRAQSPGYLGLSFARRCRGSAGSAPGARGWWSTTSIWSPAAG